MLKTAQAQLHASTYELMIFRRGRPVSWERAVLCSCWNMVSQQPYYQCAACGGFGYTFEASVEGKALVTGITESKAFQDMAGVFELGDMAMTIPKRIPTANPKTGFMDKTMKTALPNPMFDLGANDRVTLLDDTIQTSEVLQRGTDIGGRPADTLLYEAVATIIAVRKSDTMTGTVTKYDRGVDFEMVGNRVNWLGGNAPSEGENYSVTYSHHPVYVVLPINLPKPRHQDSQDLPRYAALRFRGAVTGQ